MTEISLRDAKREATAAALAQAAYGLACERGLDGFTIEEVAAAAGYSRRTFANHFAGKEEAVVAVAVAQVRDALEGAPDGPPDADLPLIDWLHAVARQQLGGGLLDLLCELRSLAERYPSLRPHLLEVQHRIRETAREAVLARVDAPADRTDAHLLVGAAYGALTCVLDGHIPVRPGAGVNGAPDTGAGGAAGAPGAPEAVEVCEMTLEDFLDRTFDHLRTGF